MRRLRVLHVLNELKPSGAEVMLLTALPTFHQNGIDLTILSTGQSRGPFAERFEAAGVEIVHAPFSRSLSYFWTIWKIFKDSRWQVIHLHSDLANFYFGIVGLATGKGVLRTVHNAFEHQGFLRWRRMIQRRALQTMGVRHVAIGASVAKNEQERFGLCTELVDNWFDDSSFRPPSPEQREAARRSHSLSCDDFAIVSVGNCNSTKNHPTILQAIAMLPSSERPVYLHAGIEDADRSEQRLATELGLLFGRDVRFLGPVNDIRTLLFAADAFIMPSHYEGLSIASLEALGTGLPVVLSDVPGLRDFREIFKGIIYCDPTAESVYSAIQDVMRLPADIRKENSRIQSGLAANRHGIEQGVRGYSRIYRSMVPA